MSKFYLIYFNVEFKIFKLISIKKFYRLCGVMDSTMVFGTISQGSSPCRGTLSIVIGDFGFGIYSNSESEINNLYEI